MQVGLCGVSPTDGLVYIVYDTVMRYILVVWATQL